MSAQRRREVCHDGDSLSRKSTRMRCDSAETEACGTACSSLADAQSAPAAQAWSRIASDHSLDLIDAQLCHIVANYLVYIWQVL